jgi:bacterioferritin
MIDKSSFFTDVATLRRRARQHIEEGAITDSYSADREKVTSLLNDALATELRRVPRYRRHHFMAVGLSANSVAQQFLQHSIEEQDHADKIASRIVQLRGEPNFSPDSLSSRSHVE